MAQEIINVGLSANDGTGDTLRSAGQKANANFTELYATSGVARLTADVTVNFTSGMTSAQMQALIDEQPKNLAGKMLTFQFANGTYTVAATLEFFGFHAGLLIIQGNSADTSSSQTKSVVLNAATDQHVINLYCCAGLNGAVRYIKTVVSTTAGRAGVIANRAGHIAVSSCAFTNANSSAAAGSGTGVHCYAGEVYATGNNFAYLDFAIVSALGRVISESNTSSVSSRYGLLADSGHIVRRAGTQPSGTTAATLAQNGGQIV